MTKQIDDFKVLYDDSPEAQKKIFDAFVDFCIKEYCLSGESIQNDNVWIEGPPFLTKLAGETFKVEYEND